ncbi:MAG: septum site-determining protein MinC [Desulfobulbaceae bacterium]|nr:septum site-determining protein MinC [Desulfobulbaceae bacterium]
MHHAQSSPSPHEAVELKGSALTVVVLHLKNSDPRLLYPQLEEVIDEAGAFLVSAPVVIDVASLDASAQDMLDFSYLLRFLHGANLMPVGVQGADSAQKDRIGQAGLLCVSTASKGSNTTAQPERTPAEHRTSTTQTTARQGASRQSVQSAQSTQPEPGRESFYRSESRWQTEQRSRATSATPARNSANDRPGSAPSPATETAMIVTQQVRAGQQISAPNGDLIVLASVNAGSELFAAGNIHVYGALRGRALAGIYGDTNARIFTLQGNPELLAIAGEYVVNEELPRWVANQSFAASWSNSGLRFQVLGP